MPDTMSFDEGACIPVVYGTAYGAIYKGGNVEPGETVLIHAAAGGVGTAAIQLAAHRGATIIGTASSSKHEALKKMGVHCTIDYRTEDVTAKVREFLGGKGPDVILDARFQTFGCGSAIASSSARKPSRTAPSRPIPPNSPVGHDNVAIGALKLPPAMAMAPRP